MMGACAGGDPAPGECTALDPEPPVEEPSTACAEPVKPCMRYRIQLQGDPTNIAADRAKYKAAFGSACYVAPDAKHRDAARVHHVVRRTDPRGCKWGSNANGNAAVISRGLNGHLHNKYPLKEEVEQINKVPLYTYTP